MGIVLADHPHEDPGDGRSECPICGKWIWPVIHSCKGVPVTPAARTRHATSEAGIFCPEILTIELGTGSLSVVYFCTLSPEHVSDHEAHGSNGRVLKAWPR